MNLDDLTDVRLKYMGDGDYDLCCGPLRIELARSADGTWTFWNVNFDGERFGGTNIIHAPAFVEWLNANAERAAA